MTTTLFAKDITLNEIESRFNLSLNEASDFFPEWQLPSPEITSQEKVWLDKVKASYMHLSKYPVMLENAVQITVLSPLLHLSNLLLPPFQLKTETSVMISTADDEIRIEGRIDILTVKDSFWVLVIESKRAELSVKVGFAQILAYMLATPTPDKPCFGLITNGSSFVFVKLVINETPQYAMSHMFDLVNPGNDLYTVLGILKNICQLI